MQYKRISADCHLDMIWLPPDLFTSEAPRELKERMPFVSEGMSYFGRPVSPHKDRNSLGRPLRIGDFSRSIAPSRN